MANLLPEETTRIADPNSLESQIREYLKIKETQTMLTARADELKEKLNVAFEAQGEEDDKGYLILNLDTPIEGVTRLEKRKRVSRKLNEPMAETIIESKGLGDELYEIKRVVSEENLMAAYFENKITEDELDSMFSSSVSWAIYPVKK